MQPLLSVPVALVLLACGFVAGSLLFRPQREGHADVSAARRLQRLGIGGGAAFLAVWLGRHLGDGPGWLGQTIAAAAERGGEIALDLVAAPLALCVWWRGEAVGSGAPERQAVRLGFAVSALALLGAAVVALAAGVTPSGLSLAMPAFLATGLAAVSLSRQREIRRDPEATWRTESPHAPAPGVGARAWNRVALPAAAAVLGVALLAPMLRGDSLRGPLAQAFQWVALGLWYGVAFVFGALWLAIRPLLETFSAIRQRLLSSTPTGPGFGIDAPPNAVATRSPETLQTPGETITNLVRVVEDSAGAVVFGSLVALLVALWFWHRYATRVMPERTGGALDEDSYWSWRQVWIDTRAWLAALLRTLQRGTRAIVSRPVRPATATSDARAALLRDVRAAYRRLLGFGAARGLARPAPQTPAEYLARWHGQLPGASPAAGLTRVYERARYGSGFTGEDEASLNVAGTLLDQIARELDAGQSSGAGSGGRAPGSTIHGAPGVPGVPGAQRKQGAQNPSETDGNTTP